MKNKQLSVRLYGNAVGVLEQTRAGKMIFSYAEKAGQAISLALPVRQKFYHNEMCEAFFGGLLPENIMARKLIGKRYGVSYNNSFALLRAIGHDCAGAISFHAMDEPVLPQPFFPLRGKIMSDKMLYTHIQNLPKQPLFLDVEELKLSLAGVHDKAAICLIDNQIAIPENGCPTTHILKPQIAEFEHVVENEYFCLKVAEKVGLVVPAVEIRQVKSSTFLLVERYDRRIQNQQVERIHQEDFCQASGIVSIKKYQREGGAGFKACFELLQNTVTPALSRNQLMAALVFNFLIGNMDAHAKNFSLLHQSAEVIQLAPFYDIVCTRVYPELSKKMAMKIGNEYDSEKIFPRHFEQLCQEIHYAYPALKRLIQNQAEKILKAVNSEKEHLKQIQHKKPIIDKIVHCFEQRITQTLKRFEHD